MAWSSKEEGNLWLLLTDGYLQQRRSRDQVSSEENLARSLYSLGARLRLGPYLGPDPLQVMVVGEGPWAAESTGMLELITKGDTDATYRIIVVAACFRDPREPRGDWVGWINHRLRRKKKHDDLAGFKLGADLLMDYLVDARGPDGRITVDAVEHLSVPYTLIGD